MTEGETVVCGVVGQRTLPEGCSVDSLQRVADASMTSQRLGHSSTAAPCHVSAPMMTSSRHADTRYHSVMFVSLFLCVVVAISVRLSVCLSVCLFHSVHVMSTRCMAVMCRSKSTALTSLCMNVVKHHQHYPHLRHRRCRQCCRCTWKCVALTLVTCLVALCVVVACFLGQSVTLSYIDIDRMTCACREFVLYVK